MSDVYLGSYRWRLASGTTTLYMGQLVSGATTGDFITILSLTITNIGNNLPRVTAYITGGSGNSTQIARGIRVPPNSTAVASDLNSKIGFECNSYLQIQLSMDGFNQSTSTTSGGAHQIGDVVVNMTYKLDMA